MIAVIALLALAAVFAIVGMACAFCAEDSDECIPEGTGFFIYWAAGASLLSTGLAFSAGYLFR